MKEEIKPVLINLADYEEVGEGANGISLNHKTDPTVLLKLYTRGSIQQPLDEWLLSKQVYEAGIPTPEPGEFVTDGTRYGIRFRRIVGKKSFARAVGEEPEKVGEYAKEFAGMCLQLHATHLDTTLFDSVKNRYNNLLKKNPFFTPHEKSRIAEFIASVPDTDTAIHGDLQFGNAIFVGEKRYFIDLGDFCYGHPYFDLGMVYLCCKMNDADWTREVFHMEPETAVAFWDAFVPAYFGPEASPEEIERMILPYAGLKTLIVERDTNHPMPEFRAALKEIL